MKPIIATLIITVFSFITRSFAIDTTECFSPGIATDFEAYYSYGWNKEGKAHGLDLLIGGGIMETLSLYISGALSKDIPDRGDSVTCTGGIGTGILWTPYENENLISVDIMPALNFEPNDVDNDGKSVKPDFKGISFCCAVEINFLIIEIFQPYIVLGYTNYRKNVETGPGEFESSCDEYPLAAGFMIPVREGIEVLSQIDWMMNEDSKNWSENERSISAGMNIMLNDNLEITTEIRRSLRIEGENNDTDIPSGWGASIGTIYAL